MIIFIHRRKKNDSIQLTNKTETIQINYKLTTGYDYRAIVHVMVLADKIKVSMISRCDIQRVGHISTTPEPNCMIVGVLQRHFVLNTPVNCIFIKFIAQRDAT